MCKNRRTEKLSNEFGLLQAPSACFHLSSLEGVNSLEHSLAPLIQLCDSLMMREGPFRHVRKSLDFLQPTTPTERSRNHFLYFISMLKMPQIQAEQCCPFILQKGGFSPDQTRVASVSLSSELMGANGPTDVAPSSPVLRESSAYSSHFQQERA